MIDLRVLRNLWTEDGARSVFAELVNQCARSIHPGCRAVRPDPGDEGIDSFVGELDGDVHVWQAKYFCDGVDTAQRGQIRKSWKACIESSFIERVARWTLCVPIELSVPELKWWQGWKRKQSQQMNCQIELWSKSDFVSFYARPELLPVFDVALQTAVKHPNFDTAIAAMRGCGAPQRPRIKSLPGGSQFKDAVFVRKLEAAGITQHRGARTAFYNFELLRAAVEQGASPDELAELEDLQERVFALWEGEFNACPPDGLGRPLVNAVEAAILREDQGRLRTSLATDAIHKQGGLHYWADVCEAGWTADFKSVAREGDEEGDEE